MFAIKRYIRSNYNIDLITSEVTFNVELTSSAESEVAAAIYKGYEIPEGELPPADKKIVMNSQVYQEYLSFIEVIEDMISDYNLNIYYKHNSENNSFYRSGLAKDDKGNNLIDFTIRIRVSTHTAHRTKESQNNKKKEKAELAKLAGTKRVTPLPINVVVNDQSEDFRSYLDAIVYFSNQLEHAYEIMTRKINKHKEEQ